MNESQTTNQNQQADSQADSDSQPPDLADQRYVAAPPCHSTVPNHFWACSLSTNKAALAAFIDKAEMHCSSMAELGATGFVRLVSCGDLPESAKTVSE